MNSETLDMFGTDPELLDRSKLKGGLEWNKYYECSGGSGDWALIDQYQPTNIAIHRVGGNCPIYPYVIYQDGWAIADGFHSLKWAQDVALEIYLQGVKPCQ